MFDWWIRKMIGTILLCLLVISVAVAVWNAIPAIIKVIAIVLIVFAFLKMVISK